MDIEFSLDVWLTIQGVLFWILAVISLFIQYKVARTKEKNILIYLWVLYGVCRFCYDAFGDRLDTFITYYKYGIVAILCLGVKIFVQYINAKRIEKKDK